MRTNQQQATANGMSKVTSREIVISQWPARAACTNTSFIQASNHSAIQQAQLEGKKVD